MNFTATVVNPPKPLVERAIDRLENATMRAATRMKRIGRDAIKAHVEPILGRGLARAWREKVFPEPPTKSLHPAVDFRPTKSAQPIIEAHENGAVIRSKRGLYLAIPTLAAGPRGGRGARGKFEKLNPVTWQARTGIKLRFVYRRPGPSWLVADDAVMTPKGAAKRRGKGNRPPLIVFLLVPQVTLRKRLDLVSVRQGLAVIFARELQRELDAVTRAGAPSGATLH